MGNRFSTMVLQRLGFCLSARVLCLASATVAAALLPAVASASLFVDPAQYEIQITAGATVVHTVGFDPGTATLGGATATATGLPVALASAQGGDGAGAKAAVKYFFVVDGPSALISVPVFVSFHLHTTAGGPRGTFATSLATFEISHKFSDDRFAPLAATITSCNPTPSSPLCNGGADLLETVPASTLTGFFHESEINISAESFGADGAGFSDPFIFIDPDFLASNPGYSVIVSAGIGNVAPAAPGVPGVPEPATLALFVSGLLGFVALRRRRT